MKKLMEWSSKENTSISTTSTIYIILDRMEKEETCMRLIRLSNFYQTSMPRAIMLEAPQRVSVSQVSEARSISI